MTVMICPQQTTLGSWDYSYLSSYDGFMRRCHIFGKKFSHLNLNGCCCIFIMVILSFQKSFGSSMDKVDRFIALAIKTSLKLSNYHLINRARDAALALKHYDLLGRDYNDDNNRDFLFKKKVTPFTIYILYSFAIYFTLKSAIICYAHLKLVGIYNTWVPGGRLIVVANQSVSNCVVRSEDLNLGLGKQTRLQIEQLYDILAKTGSPATGINDILVFFLSTSYCAWCMLFGWALFYGGREFKLDSLSLILKPDIQRQRVHHLILSSIYETIGINHDNNEEKVTSYSLINTRARISKVRQQRVNRRMRWSNECICKTVGRQNRINSIMVILNNNFCLSIMPDCCSDQTRTIIQILFVLIFTNTVVNVLMLDLFAVLQTLNVERSMQLDRLNAIEKCRSLGLDSILKKDPAFHIGSLRTRHQLESNGWLQGCLSILEANPSAQLFSLEMIIMGIILAFWLAINISNVFNGFFMRIKWACQVKKQMKGCIKLMDKLSHHQQTTKTRNEYLITQIDSLLVKTYINFGLFCKRDKAERDFRDYAGLGVFCMGLSTTFMSKTVFPGLFIRSRPLIWASLIVVLNPSFVIICGSLKNLQDLRILYQLAVMIMGRAAMCGIELKPSVQLWRKILLFDSDVEWMYATRIFGIIFTQSRVVSQLGYLVFGVFFSFDRII